MTVTDPYTGIGVTTMGVSVSDIGRYFSRFAAVLQQRYAHM